MTLLDLQNAPPGQIGATINAAIAAASNVEIVIPTGTWLIETPIICPNTKGIRISGQAGAQLRLSSTQPGDCIFKLVEAVNPLGEKFLHVTDLYLYARAAPLQSCFGVDQVQKVNHHRIHLENLRFSSNGYDVYFNNMDYCVAPRFTNLRGGHGIYWGGSIHSASNLLIEDCRFINAKRGPQIYLAGVRKWTIRNTICEGNGIFDPDVDVDAPNVLRTRSILVNNPGPNGGTIDSHWSEYWGDTEGAKDITINYTLNNGGANKPSCYSVVNTKLHRFQVLNTSTTDSVEVYATCPEMTLPDFTNDPNFRVTGKSRVFVSGGRLDSNYRFDNPNVKILSATVIKHGSEPASYRDGVSLLYAYTGGTGIYSRGATAGDWSKCRPYVQHHPKFGHSLVFKVATELRGHAFTAPMPLSLANGECSQEVWSCCPHLSATVRNAQYSAGILGSVGNVFAFEAGHAPKRIIGRCEEKPLVTFFRTSAGPDSGKWLQVFTSAAWRGGFGDSPAIAENYDCYEWPNEPGPPLGTSIVGDVCHGVGGKWRCTEAGTSRPIAVTADAVKNVASITAVSDITELLVGDLIDIAGATGTYRIIDITGGVVTLDKKIAAATNLTGAAVTNHFPVWVVE